MARNFNNNIYNRNEQDIAVGESGHAAPQQKANEQCAEGIGEGELNNNTIEHLI